MDVGDICWARVRVWISCAANTTATKAIVPPHSRRRKESFGNENSSAPTPARMSTRTPIESPPVAPNLPLSKNETGKSMDDGDPTRRFAQGKGTARIAAAAPPSAPRRAPFARFVCLTAGPLPQRPRRLPRRGRGRRNRHQGIPQRLAVQPLPDELRVV